MSKHNVRGESAKIVKSGVAGPRERSVVDFFSKSPSTSSAAMNQETSEVVMVSIPVSTPKSSKNATTPTSVNAKTPSLTKPQKAFKLRVRNALADYCLTTPSATHNTVCGSQFQTMLETVTGRKVEVPVKSTIIATERKLFHQYKQGLIEHVKAVCPQAISISYDLWTEAGGYKRSFLNVQLQFSVDFEISNINLGTTSFPDMKTGENLADELYSILLEWSLTEKYIYFIKDGGGNVRVAAELLLERYNIRGELLDCVSHALHNVLNKDVPVALGPASKNRLTAIIQNMHKQHGKLVYRLSSIANKTNMISTVAALQELVRPDADFDQVKDWLKDNALTLKLENSTRWNSLLAMFESFLDNRDAVDFELIKMGAEGRALVMSDMDYLYVEDYVKLLTPFKKASVDLQHSTKGTLFLVPFHLAKMRQAVRDNRPINLAISSDILMPALEEALNKRVVLKDCHKVAAILHPILRQTDECKRLIDMDTCAQKELLLATIRKLGLAAQVGGPVADDSDDEEDSEFDKEMKQQFAAAVPSYVNAELPSIDNEISEYLAQIVNKKPKAFFLKEKVQFPTLATLADILYGIPATTAASEANFSVAGVIASKRSTHTGEDLVSMRVFCSTNYKYLTKLGLIQTREIKPRNRTPRLGGRKRKAPNVSYCFSIKFMIMNYS